MSPEGRGDPPRLARLDLLIEQYGAARRRRLMRRAMRLWRQTEADRLLSRFDAPADRVH